MGRPKKEEQEKIRKKRRKGTALGVHHLKLSVPDGLIPSDKIGRWINDVDNRIEMALNSDYEFVTNKDNAHIGNGIRNENTDIGSKISKIVGSGKNGEPIRAYLMMIDRDWYEEDQAKKEEKNNMIEQAIRVPGYGAGQKGLEKSSMYGKMSYKS